MSIRDQLRLLHLSHLSNPPEDRPIYQAIYRYEVCRIVEIGIGTAERALKMIQLATGKTSPDRVHYTGIDLFEARPSSSPVGLSLKATHRKLSASGARVRLVPGDPYTALSRVANELPGTDLVIVSAEIDAESLARAWFFLPRMLHGKSLVFAEEPGDREGRVRPRLMTAGEIANRAGSDSCRRAA